MERSPSVKSEEIADTSPAAARLGLKIKNPKAFGPVTEIKLLESQGEKLVGPLPSEI
jgi:hypothetical protein